MRVGVSLLNYRPGSVGGTEVYIKNLIEYLPAFSGNLSFLVNRETQNYVPDGCDRGLLDWSREQTVACRVAEAFFSFSSGQAEKVVREMNVDVMLYPQQSIFPLKSQVPSVLTVADLQHLVFPRYFSVFDRCFRATAYERSLRSANQVVAISNDVKKTLVEHKRLNPGNIEVIHHGCDPCGDTSKVQPSKLGFSYFYYPAATFPHKGHSNLFRSFSALKKRGDIHLKLILTGMKTSRWRALKRLAKSLGIENDVVHLGFVSYDNVLSLYAGAEAILFPTEFEGFGLPVMEAVQFDKKVICSRLGIFDELGVPRENQIDFRSPEQLRVALCRDGTTRLMITPITWRESVRQTFDLLRRTVEEAR